MDRQEHDQLIKDLFMQTVLRYDSRGINERGDLIQQVRAIGTPIAEAMALAMQASEHRLARDMEIAKELYEQAIARLNEEDEPVWAARAAVGLVHWYNDIDRREEAAAQLHDTLHTLEECGEIDYWLVSMNDLTAARHAVEGRVDQAIECSMHAIDLAQRGGITVMEVSNLLNLGHLYIWSGRNEGALETLTRAMDLAEQHGYERLLNQSHSHLSGLYTQIGDLPKALEHISQAKKTGSGRVDRHTLILNEIMHANIYHELGEIERSMEHLEIAASYAQETGPEYLEAAAYGNIAEGYMERGDFQAAIEYVNRSIALHIKANSTAGLDYAEMLRVQILVNADRLDEAEAALAEFDVPNISIVKTRLQGFEMLADLRVKQKDYERARSVLTEALKQAQHSDVKRFEAGFHKRLRDLALQENDLQNYVLHNDAYTRITEEVRGVETARKTAMHEKQLEIQAERLAREKERAILYSTLPSHIADRIIRGEDVSGDKHDHASVLFLDVVGFTTHASELDPQVTTQLLDKVFATFDEICERHDVTKIKTIGDSYLAVAFESGAGLSAEELETEVRAASVALEMIACEFAWPDGSPLQFRIGLHCGPVVAGVIGKQRLQYDVWGDAVNVASRMESTGEPSRIQVSSEFHEQLSSRASSPVSELRSLRFTERGEVNIKGKGQMTTYWLEPSTS